MRALANDDPNDPLIVRWVMERDGCVANLSGTKDSEGMPLGLEALELWAPGMDVATPVYAMLLDERGRPSPATRRAYGFGSASSP